MFPSEIWRSPIWCLYDNMAGQVVLKHPWRCGLDVSCPYCGTLLSVDNFAAACCGRQFKTGFNEIRQVEPVGTHDRKSGRGWASLRPYAGERSTRSERPGT
jgi:hypothetical protein